MSIDPAKIPADSLSHDQALDELLDTPGARAEYDRLEPRYRLISAIIAARKKRGWTQRDLARAANMSQPVIARLESGDRDPQLSTLVAVARALGLSIRLGADTVLPAIQRDSA